MLPGTEKRKPRNSPKVNLLLSLAFHTILVLAVFYFAAREGLLGAKLHTYAISLEKPAEKPKEPAKPKPDEPAKVATPAVANDIKPVEAAPKIAAQAPPPAAMAAPPSIAPPPAEEAPFIFEGGKIVESSSDPVQLYVGKLQRSLQLNWDRPQDMDDKSFVAEVEVAVDHTGQIAYSDMKKSSGQKRWDDSVLQAIAKTHSVKSAPPPNFPSRVVVRFDVVASDAAVP
jgi:colicin import membrane protein